MTTPGQWIFNARSVRTDWTPTFSVPAGSISGTPSVALARYVLREPFIEIMLRASLTLSGTRPNYVEFTVPEAIQSIAAPLTIALYNGNDGGTSSDVYVGALVHPTGGGNKLRLCRHLSTGVAYNNASQIFEVRASYEILRP